MTYTYSIGTAVIAMFAFVGIALAQTTDQLLTITTSAATTSPAAGANAAILGTLDVRAPQAGEYGTVQVRSIPITVTAAGGAQASQLSNCQIYDANGTSVTSGSPVQPNGGSQSFTFNSPVTIAGGSSQTWTMRCNVSDATPSGGSFTFSVGTPTLAPRLGVTLAAAGSVQKGAQDATLAVMTLSAVRSSTDVTVGSIPVQVGFSGGASSTMLSDCRIRPASDMTQTISQANVQSGTNTFPLTGMQSVPSGSTFTFALTCDVAAGAPSNSTVELSLVPANVDARVTGTNEEVTAVRGFVPNTTTLGPISGTVRISPTGTGTGTSTATTTPRLPGVPNTGLGASVDALLILAVSGLVLLMGVRFLTRRA